MPQLPSRHHPSRPRSQSEILARTLQARYLANRCVWKLFQSPRVPVPRTIVDARQLHIASLCQSTSISYCSSHLDSYIPATYLQITPNALHSSTSHHDRTDQHTQHTSTVLLGTRWAEGCSAARVLSPLILLPLSPPAHQARGVRDFRPWDWD